MQRRQLYIGISIFIVILIAGLVGWAVYVGQQQQGLQSGPTDLGYLGVGGGGGFGGSSSSGGGLFGGIFGDTRDSASSDVENEERAVLRQLYNLPTSGFYKMRNDAIRFVDRANGHIFEKELPDGTTTRIDQTTVPHVYNAVFVENGEGVIRQYLDESDTIVSVYDNLRSGSTTPAASTITTLHANSDGSRIAYIERGSSGSRLNVSDHDFNNQTTLFSSFIERWNVAWAGESIALTQSPTSGQSGSSYLLSTPGSLPQLIVQQLNGLMTLPSPDGTKILYSYIVNNEYPVVFVKDIQSGDITDLQMATFAHKCVWSNNSTTVYCALPTIFPRETYPDAWLQGSVHFSDTVWEANVLTKSTKPIISPLDEANAALDIIKLAIDTKNESLYFINKTDQTLWSIQLPKEKEDTSNNNAPTSTEPTVLDEG